MSHGDERRNRRSFRVRYIPPFDWEALLAWFRHHQLPHLEGVDDTGYERIVPTSRGLGRFRVSHAAKDHALQVSVWNAGEGDLPFLKAAVRRMFDVDADPAVIRQAMTQDASLAAMWKRQPGLRIARAWSGYEAMVTTILGQLVSVSFGRTLVGELLAAAGEAAAHPTTGATIHLFPTPERLAKADLFSVRTAGMRRNAIRAIAEMTVRGALDWQKPWDPKELRKTLLSAPGIGAWTSEYVAMRAFRDDDAFPATDYGLKQELLRNPKMDLNRVRPWRAYAAAVLWSNYAESKKSVGAGG